MLIETHVNRAIANGLNLQSSDFLTLVFHHVLSSWHPDLILLFLYACKYPQVSVLTFQILYPAAYPYPVYLSIMEEAQFRKKLKQPHAHLEILPCDLPSNLLPRVGEVMGRILKLRLEEMKARKVEECCVSVKSCITKVAEEVIALWENASVPAKRSDKVVSLISALWKQKVYLTKKKQTMGTCAEHHQTDVAALFDISKSSQPPELVADREFIEDQRRPRRQKIAGLDRKTTQLWQRRTDRKAAVARLTTAAAAGAIL